MKTDITKIDFKKKFDSLFGEPLANCKKLSCNFPKKINLIITGGGLAVYYSVGVLECLRRLDIKINKISCVSGGAIMGASYLCNLDAPTISNGYRNAKKMHDEKKLNTLEVLRNEMMSQFPDNVHELCNDRLIITTNDFIGYRLNKIVHSKYNSKNDLIDIITASCTIPYFTHKSLYMYHQNKRMVDGIYPHYLCSEIDIRCLHINHAFVDYKFSNRFNFSDENIDLIIAKGMEDFKNFSDQNQNNCNGTLCWCHEQCSESIHINRNSYSLFDILKICINFIYRFFYSK